jgi:hypothetical protein
MGLKMLRREAIEPQVSPSEISAKYRSVRSYRVRGR